MSATEEDLLARLKSETALEQARRRAAQSGNIVSLKAGASEKMRAAGLLEASEKARVAHLAKNANGVVATKIPALKEPASPVQFEHRKNPSGLPVSLQNTIIAIAKLGIQCRYDIFHDKLMVEGRELKINHGESIDDICLRVRTAIISREQFDPGNQNAFDAVRRTCLANQFDPVLDYLDGLRHDGMPRLDTWLTTYLGAEDNPLNRAIGRKMLVAAVRRARQPGCKFDYIAVLEGPQGSGKSSALRILAGDENFSDAEILSANQREQQELIAGVWICELSELAGLRKTEIEKVKLFASKTQDSARPAYGRARIDRPRRCIFVGSTNDAEYLLDPTGNRRFWPLLTTKIDLAALKRDRDQLWAEASQANEEKADEELTIEPMLWPAATDRQVSRLVSDPWEDLLENIEHLVPQSSGSIVKVEGAPGELAEWRVPSEYVLHSLLNFDRKSIRSSDARRLASVMRRLGWTGPKKMRFGLRTLWAYTKPVG